MKEEPLPKIETIGQLHNALCMRWLTRWNSVGYVTGLDRSRDNTNLVSHIYKGEYDNLEKGMCKRAYNKHYKGFSIFRNNFRKGICKNCLKATLKELNQ